MIIHKYGITLRRLTEEDIELVRIMRNSDAIRSTMFYRELISPQQQKQWFDSINNIYNYYFIIEFEGKKVGLISGKNINYTEQTAEGGIFIWEENLWSGFVPALASLCVIDMAFNMLGCKKVNAEVHTANQRSITYNKLLGFILESENKEQQKQILVLSKESYFKRADKIRQSVFHFSKDHSELSWNDIDLSEVPAAELKRLYTGFPDKLQKRFLR